MHHTATFCAEIFLSICGGWELAGTKHLCALELFQLLMPNAYENTRDSSRMLTITQPLLPSYTIVLHLLPRLLHPPPRHLASNARWFVRLSRNAAKNVQRDSRELHCTRIYCTCVSVVRQLKAHQTQHPLGAASISVGACTLQHFWGRTLLCDACLGSMPSLPYRGAHLRALRCVLRLCRIGRELVAANYAQLLADAISEHAA